VREHPIVHVRIETCQRRTNWFIRPTPPSSMLEYPSLSAPPPRREMHAAVPAVVFDVLGRVHEVRDAWQANHEEKYEGPRMSCGPDVVLRPRYRSLSTHRTVHRRCAFIQCHERHRSLIHPRRPNLGSRRQKATLTTHGRFRHVGVVDVGLRVRRRKGARSVRLERCTSTGILWLHGGWATIGVLWLHHRCAAAGVLLLHHRFIVDLGRIV
jgi:hypothetical protein